MASLSDSAQHSRLCFAARGADAYVSVPRSAEAVQPAARVRQQALALPDRAGAQQQGRDCHAGQHSERRRPGRPPRHQEAGCVPRLLIADWRRHQLCGASHCGLASVERSVKEGSRNSLA